MTARLASHVDVADRTPEVLDRLVAAGVDVEFVGVGEGADTDVDPLAEVRAGSVDLALVGIHVLRGSAADDLTTVAVLPRLETRDVLVSLSTRSTTLAGLPVGSRVGLVGARRQAFLAAHRPDVEAVALGTGAMREILQTDGDRSDDGVHAVIVSALDARSAGRVDANVEALEPKAWLPDPGQGALALIARHPIAEATALDHLPTRTALRAELALLDALDVDHDHPLGCLAQPSGRWIRLWAAAASSDGGRLVRSDLTGPLDEPEGLGGAVARQLVDRGFGLVVHGGIA